MSVVLEFRQIEKNEEAIVNYLQTCELYEIDQDKVKSHKKCHLKNSDLIEKILKDRDSWKGERYNIPQLHNYLFYILALDFENNLGHRMIDDKIIFLGFDPKPIHFVISQAKKDVNEVGNSFDELEILLEEAIEKDYLIGINWG